MTKRKIGTYIVHGIQHGFNKLPFYWYYKDRYVGQNFSFEGDGFIGYPRENVFYCSDFDTVEPDVIIAHTAGQCLEVYNTYGNKYPIIYMYHGGGYAFAGMNNEDKDKLISILNGNYIFHKFYPLEIDNQVLCNFFMEHIYDIEEWKQNNIINNKNLISLNHGLNYNKSFIDVVNSITETYKLTVIDRECDRFIYNDNLEILPCVNYGLLNEFLQGYGIHISSYVSQTCVYDAMASGLACIVPYKYVWKYKGVPERDFLVFSNNSELLRCVDRLYNDDMFRVKIGMNGRKFIIENTNLNKFASDWVDYIERVIYKHKYYK